VQLNVEFQIAMLHYALTSQCRNACPLHS